MPMTGWFRRGPAHRAEEARGAEREHAAVGAERPVTETARVRHDRLDHAPDAEPPGIADVGHVAERLRRAVGTRDPVAEDAAPDARRDLIANRRQAGDDRIAGQIVGTTVRCPMMSGNTSTPPSEFVYAVDPSGSIPQRAHFHASTVSSELIAAGVGRMSVNVPSIATAIVRGCGRASPRPARSGATSSHRCAAHPAG